MVADTTATHLLAGAAAAGDEAAWQAIVDRHVPPVFAICHRCGLSESDTAAVVQVVFAGALERLPALARPGALLAWLATATRRECLLVVHRSSQRGRTRHGALPAWTAPTDVDADLLARVRISLSRLPGPRRRMAGLGRETRSAPATCVA